ncbi:MULTISPECIES: HTH domain-containing protein [Oceanotoga]|jgi:predicted transcriptional regulator|uniref:HTH domain-containing protein n=1 Tax=Oceanotoga TaxID=1255275 RepID=UPI00265649A8|nr:MULTISPECIES: HTH domain-containing protein [Oceanotoga]MDN5343303.1 hypothetical protein [Oceanotoga sp.]MDO7976325.1 HTH domain-containing protein [Oceanotoga teriensis]
MYDLIKVLTNEHFFKVIEYLNENPESNPSKIAKKLKIHTATVQNYLETLEKYKFVVYKEKKGLGRPSKLYSFKGGSFEVNLNELLEKFYIKNKKIRDAGNEKIKYSYDVEKEIINTIIIDKHKKETIKLDSKSGKFLWLLPPPNSNFESIEKLCLKSGFSILEAVELCLYLQKKGVLEIK